MKKTIILNELLYKIIYFIIIKMKRNLFQSDKKMLNRSSRAMSMLSLKKMDESTVGTLGNWS